MLDAELKRQKLEGRDKAFASAIFYTVLEHRGTLDYILERFLPKGLAKLDAPCGRSCAPLWHRRAICRCLSPLR